MKYALVGLLLTGCALTPSGTFTERYTYSCHGNECAPDVQTVGARENIRRMLMDRGRMCRLGSPDLWSCLMCMGDVNAAMKKAGFTPAAVDRFEPERSCY